MSGPAKPLAPASTAAGGSIIRELKVLGPDQKALKREKIVDVLWAMQEKRGWISDEDVVAAGLECDLSPSEVDEVATFYNLLLRSPAGRTKIYVCDSISCELCGAAELTRRVSEVLGIQPGETTKDGEFTLLPIVCLGHCEMAPCLLAGETVHGPLETSRAAIEALFQRIRNERGSASRQG